VLLFLKGRSARSLVKRSSSVGMQQQSDCVALGREQKHGERPDAGSIPVTPPRSPLTPASTNKQELDELPQAPENVCGVDAGW
jgi:hypothetical protein